MRLLTLAPVWIHYDPKWRYIKNKRPVGIRFKCPHCQDTQICVLFLNPMDGNPSAPNDDSIPGNNGGVRWARSGLEFDEMSLSPSIDVPGHWHGYVLNGEVT